MFAPVVSAAKCRASDRHDDDAAANGSRDLFVSRSRALGHREDMHSVRALPAPEVAPLRTTARRSPDATELVLRARAGDRWALEALYRDHVADVTRVAVFLLGRSSDVDDVIQDAFVRAFAQLPSLRETSAFGGWLARITANEARSRLRRRRLLSRLGLDRGEEDVPLDQFLSDGATPDERAEIARAARTLAQLAPDERVAWTLRHVEGWSLDETADALGVSLATVKRRLQHAEEQVRRAVDAPAEGRRP
jgi:RNA polymerase sigma-70 factor (ECF subfamily)